MTELYLVGLPVDPRAFTAWAIDHRYLNTPPGDGRGRPRDPDIGYALHASLAGLFGTQSPRPFVVPSIGQRERQQTTSRSRIRGGALNLLGYSRVPAETLCTLARLADDDLFSMINWDGVRSRRMPARWPEHLRLRFDLRACPVRRIIKPLTTTTRPSLPATTFPKGSEVDAYQVAAVRARDSRAAIPGRGQIYIEWLGERLGPRPGQPQAVSLVPGSVRVESYRSVRLLRRPRGSNGRRSHRWLTRPDVRFTGLLDIADPTAIPALLMSGVGRHCGFGFGMLLLRPA